MSPGRTSRHPPVSVVMPFAGTVAEAQAALGSLAALQLGDDDELILADNCGIALSAPAPVRVIEACGERSPAHARNAGAGAAAGDAEWILFLDADTVAPPDLLDRYFAEPIAGDVGAVAGGITAAPLGPSAPIAARYGAHKNFLDAGAHLAHPFMPRAAAANLLVRRAAFEAVGGFFEGLRAGEDTDFSWRLQLAGWMLAGRSAAVVEHRYRASLPALRRQWRGYAAGRAWLGRRYDGFAPQPALVRAAGTLAGRATGTCVRRAADRPAPPPADRPAPPPAPGVPLGDNDRQVKAISHTSSVPGTDRVRFAALDALLGVDELIGFALSNRPSGVRTGQPGARRVLVADRFPDPENDAHTDPGRIEADRRADREARPPAGVTIVYREDDGPLDRARALAALAARRPGRLLTAAARTHDDPSPAALSPAACRLLSDPDATLSPLSADPRVQAAAQRLAWLAGRELS